MSQVQTVANVDIDALNALLEGTSIAPIAKSNGGKVKIRSRKDANNGDLGYGFKADGTPRKRPVPHAAIAAKRAQSNGDNTVTVKSNQKESNMSKPTVKTRNEREQDSITATMIRGKRDWKTGVIDTEWLPKSGGGVRFEENVSKNWRSPEWMSQEDFEAIGSPEKIRVTIKAL